MSSKNTNKRGIKKTAVLNAYVLLTWFLKACKEIKTVRSIIMMTHRRHQCSSHSVREANKQCNFLRVILQEREKIGLF